MKKYLTITTAIIFALNAQTFLFAKDNSKAESTEIAFEQLLNTKDLTALLSDSGAIALERILLSPEEIVYNDLTKSLSSENKTQIFETNINNVNKKASQDIKYSKAVADAYYKMYVDIVENPNISPDFNLNMQQLRSLIYKYQDNIINLLKDSYAFKTEQRNNPKLTLSDYLNKIVNKNITLLSQYVKANPGVKLYDCKELENKIIIKEHKDWPNFFTHNQMLIEVAALRVIEANLKYAKTGLTYDLALFDIISIARTSATQTTVKFYDNALTFNIPKDSYIYVPFGTLKLVSRDAKFITALQEIEKKKQNPNYDFATHRDSSKPARGQDYNPAKQPSVYDSPWGAGSVR